MSKPIDQVKQTVSRISEEITGRLSDSPKAVAGALGLAAAAAAGAYAVRRTGSRRTDMTPFHVVSTEDGWQLRNEGADEVVASFGRKRDAIREGRRLAGDQRPSCLVVHNSDGTISRTHTYRPQAT